MAFRDILVRANKTPGRSRKSFRISLLALPLNLLVFLIAYSSDSWLISPDTYNYKGINHTLRNQGLWRYCQKASDLKCCGYINDVIGFHDQNVPAFVNATRALITVGMAAQTLCWIILLSSVLYFGKDGNEGNSKGKVVIVLLYIITALNVCSAAITYGAAYSKHDWTSQCEFSCVYGFAVLSLLFYILSLIEFCCE